LLYSRLILTLRIGDKMNIPIMLALLALLTHGATRFFEKIAGANRAYGPSFMLCECVGFGVIAIIIHLVQRHPFDLAPKMAGLALLGGALSGVAVWGLLLAFRLGGEGSTIFPIAGLAVVVSVILSFIVYREPVTATKLLGLGLGMSSIIVLSR